MTWEEAVLAAAHEATIKPNSNYGVYWKGDQEYIWAKIEPAEVPPNAVLLFTIVPEV